MDRIDWTKYSWLCYDPDTDNGKLMKEKSLTCLMAEHGEWNVWMWINRLTSLSLLASTVVMSIPDGRILIITIYVHVMRCNPEERRTSYSRHSFEWIGVKECVDIQWEEFHSFPIKHNKNFISSHFHGWGWHGRYNQCTTFADFDHATDITCIWLQDHRQQRILIARGRPILILQDCFCRPSAHTTHHHL